MKNQSLRFVALLIALAATGTAVADHNFGVGVKAGTLGIGVEGISKAMNVGSIMRSAHAFGASFVFTVGAIYKGRVTRVLISGTDWNSSRIWAMTFSSVSQLAPM